MSEMTADQKRELPTCSNCGGKMRVQYARYVSCSCWDPKKFYFTTLQDPESWDVDEEEMRDVLAELK